MSIKSDKWIIDQSENHQLISPFEPKQIRELNGEKIDYLPAAVEDQLRIKPIYKTFPGWKTSTNGIKNIEELPENAKNYIYAVEDFTGTKISSISTSPEREDTILIENPFEIN